MFSNKLMTIAGLSLCCLLCSCSMAEKTYAVKQLAPDGVWTWFNDERIIVDGDVLLIGSIDSRGVSRVDCYDLKTGGRKAYPLSSWQSADDHNNPALLKMSNGNILACYAQHTREKKWYCRIGQPDPGQPLSYNWFDEQTMDLPADATYNNLFELSDENGRIYNFMRCIGWNPTVLISDTFGKTWNPPVELIRSGDNRTRPYVKYSGNGKDRIDLIYTDAHPRQAPTNNVYHLYYQKGNLRRSDGSVIRSLEDVQDKPVQPKEGTMIYTGSEDGRGWVWDLEYDKHDDPVVAFINSADHEVGNDLRYRYGRWDADKKQWHQQQIAFAGTNIYVPENHYAGGIAIDPEDVNIVYISCDVDPVSGEANDTGHYQIYQGRTKNRGKTWEWKQLTFDTDTDNLRPVVPRHHDRKICVIWFQGEYKTYTDYKTRIVGIIER